MGVSKESTSKFLIGNAKNVLVDSTYLNTDMCKFESSQKDESRALWTDSSNLTEKLEL